jgi:ABC-type transport system involved in multi-copper enzyme maturation permease subunit
MFKTLLLKEIHEKIISGKFLVTSLLCLTLIPLGMYVTLKEYKQRLNTYQNAQRLYLERSEGRIDAEFEAQGYRPPSPLSIFAFGLEQFLPDKAVTSNGRSMFSKSTDGMVLKMSESTLTNPMSVLFGKMDFLFNVAFVLTIFIFLSTFSIITGERESGTFKLLMSNPIPRWVILAAKITGSFVIFIMPFLVSFIIGLILISVSQVVPLTSNGFLSAVLVILAVTIVFLLCMHTLGLFISASTNNSMLSISVSLLLWTFFALIIPKLSPMIAQIIKPVEAEQVLMNKIENARLNLKIELLKREDELFLGVLRNHGVTNDDYMRINGIKDSEKSAIESEYDDIIADVRTEYAEKMKQATATLSRAYNNSLHEQERITRLISRLSPVCCYTFLLTEIAGTGTGEIENFENQAENFQNEVEQSVYDKFQYRQYGSGMYNVLGFWGKPDVDYNTMQVPQMTGYQRASLTEAFAHSWVDLLLLGLYTILFFTGAFVKFLRYDVR